MIRGMHAMFYSSEADALRLLVEIHNPLCQPPWTETELAHKVADAATVIKDKTVHAAEIVKDKAKDAAKVTGDAVKSAGNAIKRQGE